MSANSASHKIILGFISFVNNFYKNCFIEKHARNYLKHANKIVSYSDNVQRVPEDGEVFQTRRKHLEANGVQVTVWIRVATRLPLRRRPKSPYIYIRAVLIRITMRTLLLRPIQQEIVLNKERTIVVRSVEIGLTQPNRHV